MKKKLFLIFIFLLIFGLSFFAVKSILALHTCADPPLTTFSDGSTVKTVIIPSGGGTLEAARIKLPMGSTITPPPCSAELTINRTVATSTAAGTPYIWVPLSGTNRLVQIKTSDGTIVHIFANGADNCAANAFHDPSRITVFPEAAVWVANRGNGTVTRLGLKAACIGDDCYECKGTYSDVGDGPRGVTYDVSGNVWTGAYTNDRMCKYQLDGTLITCQNTGCQTYGMIGDMDGNVWVADHAIGKVCKCSGAISCSSGFSDSVYGIGMDNEGDIWVGNPSIAEVNEIKGASYGTNAGKILQTCSMPHENTGIAVDTNNNVWNNGHWDNQTYVIKGGDCSKVFTKSNICMDRNPFLPGVQGYPHGVAIDSNNNGWVVCRTGEVIKYAFHDDGDAVFADDGNDDIEEKLRIDLNTCCGSGITDQASYNYSDMTGLRTPKIGVTIGSFPITTVTYPQVINDANYPGFSASLQNDFAACSHSVFESICGNPFCEVPIFVSSVFLGGTYTLSNLEIKYEDPESKISGGLVPCGRICDDMSTAMREDDDCTLCHLFVLFKRVIDFLFLYLVIPVAILLIVIGGAMFLFSAEDPQRIEQGKTILKTVLIGFVIFFAAWLIVNVAIFFITEGRPPLPSEIAKIFDSPWNEIPCPLPP